MKRLLKWGLAAFAIIVVISILANTGEEEATTTTQAVVTAPAVTTTETTEAAVAPATTAVAQDPHAQAYVAELQPILLTMADALGAIGEVAPTWPAWTEDDEKRMILGLVTMQAMEASVSALDPPASMMAIHGKVLEAAGHMKTASQKIAAGIDAMDGELITEGTDAMLAGNAAINEATALIQALQ